MKKTKTIDRTPRMMKGSDHIRLTPTEGMTKEEWLAERAKSIGGSEIGGIVGTSPYASAYSIWCERTGKFPPFEGNLATEVGTCLEDYVARKFGEISGFKIEKTNFIYRNDRFPVMHASPDRIVVKETIGLSGKKTRRMVAGLECKTTNSYNAGKIHDCDFPVIYYSQCVQYMMVTELPTWYLAVLVGNNEFHIFMLTIDPAAVKPDWCEGRVLVPQVDMEALKTSAEQFWLQLQTNTAPDPDGSEATGDAIRKSYPEVKEGTADLWGSETLLQDYWSAKEATKAAKAKEDQLAQRIQLLMDGHEDGECIGYKVRWHMQDGKQTFDYKACIAHNPDMVEYLKVGKPFRKFEVKHL